MDPWPSGMAIGSRQAAPWTGEQAVSTSSSLPPPRDINGCKVAVGVSIGVAMAPEAGTDRGELARKADIALYRAKKSTSERFKFFTEEMGQKIQSRRELEMELRQALDTGIGLGPP